MAIRDGRRALLRPVAGRPRSLRGGRRRHAEQTAGAVYEPACRQHRAARHPRRPQRHADQRCVPHGVQHASSPAQRRLTNKHFQEPGASHNHTIRPQPRTPTASHHTSLPATTERYCVKHSSKNPAKARRLAVGPRPPQRHHRALPRARMVSLIHQETLVAPVRRALCHGRTTAAREKESRDLHHDAVPGGRPKS